MNLQSNIDNIESGLDSWHPRDIIRHTNWLYCVDALYNHDMHEMHIIWKVASLFEGYATQIIVWAYAIRLVISNNQDDILSEGLKKIPRIV